MAGGNGRGRRRFGLRAKSVLALSFLALTMTGIAAVSYVLLTRVERRLLVLYHEHVVPVRELKSVSDRFAIDIVDTIHKTCAGVLPPRDAALRVEAALRDSETSWRAVLASAAVAADLRGTGPLLDRATAAASRARDLMTAGDLEGLERFRLEVMYPAIEPLTRRLEQHTRDEIAATDALVRDTRASSRTLRLSATAALVAISALALALAAWLSRRLVLGLAQIDAVVRAVSEGDLSQRVELRGHDELGETAGRIDAMITALARSAQQARAASTAKSLFLGGMSHELRTPLNVILGHTQIMVRERDRSVRDRETLGRIVDASGHLLSLIEDVLSISKIEAGRIDVRHRPFAPAALLSSVRALFAHRAADKGLALAIDGEAALPPRLEGDEGKIRQILVNLVSNAIKFTTRGEVRVALWHEGNELHGSVRDTGPGIPAEERALLFQTFHQGRAGLEAAEGTGLGLYISASLAKHMGGELRLHASSPEGSELRFRLVATRGASDEPMPRPPHTRRLAPGTRCAPMLIVDDNAANREVLGQLLRALGFEVEEVGDGQRAVARCERETYALIWMDLRMPVLDGRGALRAIHTADAQAGRPPRKIVAITASVLELSPEQAREDGFVDLVGKPFRVEEITAIVEAVLEVELEDLGPAGPEVATVTGPVTADDLAPLPEPLRARLLWALVAGDAEQAEAALADVPAGALADSLRRAVRSYAFDPLITALREAEGRSDR